MNYQKIYNQIIKRAKVRKLTGYKEKHHIIPRCMNGSNNKDNLVNLTAKEHYICHKLLCFIYPKNSRLNSALWFLSCAKSKGQERHKVSARVYTKLKEEYSIQRSLNSLGEKNPNYGKKRSLEWKVNSSIKQKENHEHLKGENNPSKNIKVRKRIAQTKLGEKNPRFCNWEIITPNGVKSIIPGGYHLVKYLANLGFTKAMFYKKEGVYKVQKDGWKLKTI